MKILRGFVVMLVFILLVVDVAMAFSMGKDNYYVNEEKGYKFKILSKNWKESDVEVLDVRYMNKKGGKKMAWFGAGAFPVWPGFSLNTVDMWWVNAISKKYNWKKVKVFEQKTFLIKGCETKLIKTKFDEFGFDQIDITCHIWVPFGKYNVYRLRMVCAAEDYEIFEPIFYDFVESFELLKENKASRQALRSFHAMPAMYDWHFKKLKKKGLEDPLAEIVSDLMQHKELIPYKGSLGGTMGFYFPDQIYVLNDRWVFAYFEDGHVGGHALLEYQVSDKGKIKWKVLDAYSN